MTWTPDALPPEERLLLFAVEPEGLGAERLADFPFHELNWDRVRLEGARHGVLPLLLRKLHALQIEVPGGAPSTLISDVHVAAAYTLSLARELLRLVQALEEAGIPTVPFKGPALGAQLYGDAGIRPCSDLDILISPGDTEGAAEALRNLGYRSPTLSPGRRRLTHRHGHALGFQGAAGQTVELHWRVTSPLHPFSLTADAILAHAVTVELSGYQVPVPCPLDLLPMLAAHGAKHVWQRLVWIHDVALLLGTVSSEGPENVDRFWNDLERSSRTGGYFRLVLWGVAVAREILGAPIPDRVQGWIESEPGVGALVDETADALFQPPLSGGSAAAIYLSAWPGWRSRSRILARTLVALGPEDWGGSRLPDSLLWLLYPRRVLRLGLRHVVQPWFRGPGR